MIANGTFTIQNWEEETYRKLDEEGGLNQAHVTQAFSGDITGEGEVEYLMTYLNKTTAYFTGQQFIEGQIGDRSGSFVLHLSGTFDGSSAEAHWAIVEGSGTGELKGIAGEGTFKAPLGQTATYSLKYSFG